MFPCKYSAKIESRVFVGESDARQWANQRERCFVACGYILLVSRIIYLEGEGKYIAHVSYAETAGHQNGSGGG